MNPSLWLVVFLTALSVVNIFGAAWLWVEKWSYAGNAAELNAFDILSLIAVGIALSSFMSALSVPINHGLYR